MRSLWEKIKREGDVPASSSGIEFTPQIGGRKFRRLNKDSLQKEEEENLVQMEKKMRQVGGDSMWSCRDCNWKGKYRHRAKAHARDCGQRRREHVKQFKEKKFQCSAENCDMSFTMKSQLLAHYKSLHVNPSQVYSCIPCRKTFTEWRNFSRHNQEKHGEPGKFCCSKCGFKTNRLETLRRHQKAKHESMGLVRDLLGDIIDEIVMGNVTKEAEESTGVALALIGNIINNVVENDAGDEVEDHDIERISAYEKARNDWVAFVQSEFHRQFPTYRKELDDLKGVRVPKPRRSNQPQPSKGPARKSSRIKEKYIPPTETDCSGDGSDDKMEDITDESGLEVIESTVEDNSVVLDSEEEAGNVSVPEAVSTEVIIVGDEDVVAVADSLGKFACIPCKKSFRYKSMNLCL